MVSYFGLRALFVFRKLASAMVINSQNFLEQVARRTRELRNEAGVSQDTFAAFAGVHRSLVAKVESGNRNISIETLERLAIAAGVDAASLVSDKRIARREEPTAQIKERVVQNIRRLRNERAYSQEKLSARAGLSRNYVALLEVSNQNIDVSSLFKLAEALDVPPSELLVHQTI
ncbi:helix-turn-helix domain-containing protein [Pandoraea communis]|nr:helix-turn-helix transcriptional regulator [Pandoraea communis]